MSASERVNCAGRMTNWKPRSLVAKGWKGKFSKSVIASNNDLRRNYTIKAAAAVRPCPTCGRLISAKGDVLSRLR